MHSVPRVVHPVHANVALLDHRVDRIERFHRDVRVVRVVRVFLRLLRQRCPFDLVPLPNVLSAELKPLGIVLVDIQALTSLAFVVAAGVHLVLDSCGTLDPRTELVAQVDPLPRFVGIALADVVDNLLDHARLNGRGPAGAAASRLFRPPAQNLADPRLLSSVRNSSDLEDLVLRMLPTLDESDHLSLCLNGPLRSCFVAGGGRFGGRVVRRLSALAFGAFVGFVPVVFVPVGFVPVGLIAVGFIAVGFVTAGFIPIVFDDVVLVHIVEGVASCYDVGQALRCRALEMPSEQEVGKGEEMEGAGSLPHDFPARHT